jgi:MFS transporter, DHA1 family, inner membrane transport protein
MLAALCAATFVATTTGTGMAPFLLDMARDLASDLASVGTLVAISSVTWGMTSLAAGSASDRLGRRPILAAGLLVLAASRLGVASSGSYASAALWQLLAGVGGGAFMGTVFAAVSDHVPTAARGRALGWVITGQSLSLVLGVPLVTLVGSVGGWRGAMVAQGLAAVCAAAPVWLSLPGARGARPREQASSVSVWKVLDFRIVSMLGAGTTERACFAALAVYLATFLVMSYGASLDTLALSLALVALGNLAGNVLGARLADRLPDRLLTFAAASVATALLVLPLMLWRPGPAVSVGLGFAYALVNALGRPALLAALSDAPAHVRGAILGLNITAASFGWLGASALGGWLIATVGFGGLGVFIAVTALVGAALAAAARRPG